jgi:hypothetical protein
MHYSSDRRKTRYPWPLKVPLADAAPICGIRDLFIRGCEIVAPTLPYTSDNDYTRNFHNQGPLRRPAPPSPHFPIPASISRVISPICPSLDSPWPLRTPLEDAALICGIRVGFIGWNQIVAPTPPYTSDNDYARNFRNPGPLRCPAPPPPHSHIPGAHQHVTGPIPPIFGFRGR